MRKTTGKREKEIVNEENKGKETNDRRKEREIIEGKAANNKKEAGRKSITI